MTTVVEQMETQRTRSRLLAAIEDHPLLAVAAVALLARVVVATAIAVFFGGSLFPDDKTFHVLASELASGDTEKWDSGTHALYRQTATYVLPLAGVYALFGSVVFLGQLLTTLFGTAAAVLASRVGAAAGGSRVGLASGFIVALLPSQVLWSSLTLKDAAVWTAIAAIGLVIARRADNASSDVLRAIPLAALFLLLGYLRMHTLVVVGWATVLAVVAAPPPRRRATLAAVALIVLVVPWALGAGPAGSNLIRGGLGSIGERRAANAAGAETAVADPEDYDPGLLDNLRHLPRGITVMLFEPVPWAPTDDPGETLARVETVLWYPLLALAALGGRDLIRRRDALAFPFFAGGGVMLLYALLEGNIGTAYRHRGEFVWAVCVFAAVGLARLWPKLRETDPMEQPGSLNPS